MLERIQKHAENLLDKFKVQVASGKIIEVNKSCNIRFSVDRIANVEFTEEYYLMEGDPPVLLLGETFLIQEEVCIDYKEAT